MKKYDILELAYELYKIDWVHNNTTLKDRLKSMREYRQYQEEAENYGVSIMEYEDYLWENGYGGALYVCMDEFEDEEFMDTDYMRYLLGEKLFDEYLKAKE